MTEAGLVAHNSGEHEDLLRGSDLVEAWYAKLSKAGRMMLEVLVENYPRPVSKLDLISKAGYQDGGAANNGIGEIVSRSLAERVKDSEGTKLKATAALMETL